MKSKMQDLFLEEKKEKNVDLCDLNKKREKKTNKNKSEVSMFITIEFDSLNFPI